MTTPRDAEQRRRFRDVYGRPRPAVYDAVEEKVLGAAWGANGYTTKAQADMLLARLELQPGQLLLDVGTGRGWPGLYLAARSGCRLLGTDIPVDALRSARNRAGMEAIAEHVALVAASGAAPPLRAGIVDGVVHTDVVC